jgi:hypothetical protein
VRTVWAFRRTVRDISIHLRHELCWKPHYYYELFKEEAQIVRDQARIVWPLGTDHPPVENQKNPEVPGSVKFIFNILTDRPGCTIRPSVTALSDDTFNAIIATDIAITADRCDFSHWCVGADRLEEEKGWKRPGLRGLLNGDGFFETEPREKSMS